MISHVFLIPRGVRFHAIDQNIYYPLSEWWAAYLRAYLVPQAAISLAEGAFEHAL